MEVAGSIIEALERGELPCRDLIVRGIKECHDQRRFLLDEISFPLLLIDGMDAEQIWSMLAITNEEILPRLEKTIFSPPPEKVPELADNLTADPASDAAGDLAGDPTSDPTSDPASDLAEDPGSDPAADPEPDLTTETPDLSESTDQSDYSEGESDAGDVKSLKYKDFFGDAPPQPLDLSSEDSDEDSLTPFQRNQRRIEKEISALEQKNVSQDKPWEMLGEVSATQRPKDSLLFGSAAEIEFETTARPKPVVTVESRATLEQLIVGRIKDALFDDLERKPAAAEPAEPKQVELEDEKSKRSLDQIYSQQPAPAGGALDDQHKEIQGLMAHLMSQLDSISNFNLISRGKKENFEVVSNLSAIEREESIPVAVSSAPGTIEGQKSQPIGRSELTVTTKRKIAKERSAKRKPLAKDDARKFLSKQRNVIVRNEKRNKK